MPKSVVPSGAMKSTKFFKEKKRSDLTVLTKTPRQNRFFQQNFQAASLKQWC